MRNRAKSTTGKTYFFGSQKAAEEIAKKNGTDRKMTPLPRSVDELKNLIPWIKQHDIKNSDPDCLGTCGEDFSYEALENN